MITKNELELLLNLNGNNRLLHLEEEIFSGKKEIVHAYLESLTRGGMATRYPDIIAMDKYIVSHTDVEWAIHMYAKYIINGRWPAAEGLFTANSFWYNQYCNI